MVFTDAERKHRYRLSFNGSTDYVDILDSPSLDIVTEITIAFWYKAISDDIPSLEKSSNYLMYWDGDGGIYGRAYPNDAFGKWGFYPEKGLWLCSKCHWLAESAEYDPNQELLNKYKHLKEGM